MKNMPVCRGKKLTQRKGGSYKMKAEMLGFHPAHHYLTGTREGFMVLTKAASKSLSPWSK